MYTTRISFDAFELRINHSITCSSKTNLSNLACDSRRGIEKSKSIRKVSNISSSIENCSKHC